MTDEVINKVFTKFPQFHGYRDSILSLLHFVNFDGVKNVLTQPTKQYSQDYPTLGVSCSGYMNIRPIVQWPDWDEPRTLGRLSFRPQPGSDMVEYKLGNVAGAEQVLKDIPFDMYVNESVRFDMVVKFALALKALELGKLFKIMFEDEEN